MSVTSLHSCYRLFSFTLALLGNLEQCFAGIYLVFWHSWSLGRQIKCTSPQWGRCQTTSSNCFMLLLETNSDQKCLIWKQNSPVCPLNHVYCVGFESAACLCISRKIILKNLWIFITKKSWKVMKYACERFIVVTWKEESKKLEGTKRSFSG